MAMAMQKAPSAEERRVKMAQQRQLALNRQRNAVLTGLGVTANQDAPAGGPSPTAVQSKQVLGRLLLTQQGAQPAHTRQDTKSARSKQSTDVGAAPSAAAGASPRRTPRRLDTSPRAALATDGIEVCRLGTPLIASTRPEGADAPCRPAASDAGLWNLQGDVLQAPADGRDSSTPTGGNPADKKPGKRSSWRPWRAPAPAAARLPASGTIEFEETGVVEIGAIEDDADRDNGLATPRARGGRRAAAEQRSPASRPAGGAPPQTQASTPLEAMPGQPESPSEMARKFCRPGRAMGPPCGDPVDQLDILQDVLLSS